MGIGVRGNKVAFWTTSLFGSLVCVFLTLHYSDAIVWLVEEGGKLCRLYIPAPFLS